jgi:hypothetical protein
LNSIFPFSVKKHCQFFMQVIHLFQIFLLDNHLTSEWSNSYVDSAFISNYSLVKILEVKALNFITCTAWMTRDTICFKPDGKVFAANICLWITQCVPMAFGATVFIKTWNPDLQPNMAGAPSVQTAHSFFQSITCSSKSLSYL